MADFADRLQPSAPYPLGAHWDGRGTHFAVFSEHASRVELCLFDPAGRHETRLWMPECTDGIWHGYLANARPGQLYGYRADGPYDPKRGHRFNVHKLLLDPYARQLAGEFKWHNALHGYRIARRIEQISGGAFALNQGTLYPALVRLEQIRWIASRWGESDSGRRVKIYSLTPAGRRELRKEEDAWRRVTGVIERFFSIREADS